jgi:hypothetical protein
MARAGDGKLNQRLERLAAAVAAATGDNLVSLVLYGSAAAGTRGAQSDVNLLMVLRDASAAALHPLGDALRDWLRSGERAPLVFSLDGWRRAADVFPIEIEDIRQRHRVLRGSDPVADLTTTRDDLRRELEREARGLLVQLRASYAAAASDGKALAAVVRDSLRTVLVLFRASLRLGDGAPPESREALVEAVGRAAGFDPSAFRWPLEQQTAARPGRLRAHDPTAAAYLDAVASFVAYVDRS